MTRDLLRVDDDDEVAGVDVRRVLRLVLAAQRVGDVRRETAEGLALGVDDVPAALDLAGLCVPGLLHGRKGGEHEASAGADCSSTITSARARAARAASARRPRDDRARRGATAIAAAPTASAATPSTSKATPPSRASAAPVRPESEVGEADEPAALGQAASRSTSCAVPRRTRSSSRAEAEEREARSSARSSTQTSPSVRDAHDDRPPTSAGRAPDPVDQVADDEHERVHADDVRADDREDVVLRWWCVVDDDVAGQVHHRRPSRRSSRRRRAARGRRPAGGGSRRAARPVVGGVGRRAASRSAITFGSGRTQREHEARRA